MDCADVVRALLKDAQEAIDCIPSGRPDSWLVSTPVLYHDSDLVQVLVEDVGGGEARVSDAAFTSMRLDMAGASLSGEARQERMRDTVREFGVAYSEGLISTRVQVRGIADAVWRVASAAVQLEGFVHDEPPTAGQKFDSELRDWIGSVRSDIVSVPNAKLPDSEWTVTSRLETRTPLYVQAIGAKGSQQQHRIGSAAFAFAHSRKVRPGQKLVVTKHALRGFTSGQLGDLTEVCSVASLASSRRLEDYIHQAAEGHLLDEGSVLTPVPTKMG